jgi:hypothetical protein
LWLIIYESLIHIYYVPLKIWLKLKLSWEPCYKLIISIRCFFLCLVHIFFLILWKIILNIKVLLNFDWEIMWLCRFHSKTLSFFFQCNSKDNCWAKTGSTDRLLIPGQIWISEFPNKIWLFFHWSLNFFWISSDFGGWINLMPKCH